MLLLTFVVWVYMFVRRMLYLSAQNIDAEELISPERVAAIIPEDVNSPANNLKNLVELPVLFYAICLYLYATQQVDSTYLYAAYVFFVFRALHSVVHCTFNKVMVRFALYLISSVALWVMVVRAAV